MLIKEYRICMPLTVEEVGELRVLVTPSCPVTNLGDAGLPAPAFRPFTPAGWVVAKLREVM